MRAMASTRTRPNLAAVTTEADLQRIVTAYARLRGWKFYHTRYSLGSGAGYPDLTLVRERVVWIELKSMRGALTQAQIDWRDALQRSGAEWHCWRPDVENAEIERVLG